MDQDLVNILHKCQAIYEAQCKAKHIVPEPYPLVLPAPATPESAPTSVQTSQPKVKREGKLNGTSKAAQAREIMLNTKDKGIPFETVIQMIMDATGHDKALAKATYKANAARVGITL